MSPDLVPIHVFVEQQVVSPAVQKIIETWRVEPVKIVEMLVEHFRDMGIFHVDFRLEPHLAKALFFQLKHSPEIHRVVTRANDEELRKQRNRTA